MRECWKKPRPMTGSSRFRWAQGSPGQCVTEARVQGKPRPVLIAGDMSREEGGLLLQPLVGNLALLHELLQVLDRGSDCPWEKSRSSQCCRRSLPLPCLLSSTRWCVSLWLKTTLWALVGSLGSSGIVRTRAPLAGTIRRRCSPMHPRQVGQRQRQQRDLLGAHTDLELVVRTWRGPAAESGACTACCGTAGTSCAPEAPGGRGAAGAGACSAQWKALSAASAPQATPCFLRGARS